MQTEEMKPDSDNAIGDADPAQTVTPDSPGALLQAARLAQDLTEKDVADKLHITMHYVRAIEANRFDKLPGAVFAKGYIKSYALMLGLDVATVTGLFDGLNSDHQERIEEANRRHMARRRHDRNMPWVYGSAACFIVGFAALWAYNYYSEPASPAVAPATSNESVPQNAPPTIASRPIAQTPVRTAPAAPVAVSTPELTAGTAQEPELQAPAPTDATVTEPDLGTALVALANRSGPEPDVAVPADTAPRGVARTNLAGTNSQNVITVDAEGNDVLRISFSGESWVEVNDSHAKQIYRDILEAGDVLEITGDAPFNILLGDAPFTTMYLNGTEIDVSNDIRIDNSARLTVGL